MTTRFEEETQAAKWDHILRQAGDAFERSKHQGVSDNMRLCGAISYVGANIGLLALAIHSAGRPVTQAIAQMLLASLDFAKEEKELDSMLENISGHKD